MDVLVVIDDLIFETKIRSTAKAAGANVLLIKPEADVAARIHQYKPSLVMIDLGSTGDAGLDAVVAARRHVTAPRVLAYLPHVDTQLAKRGIERGAHDVMPRSRLSTELPRILVECLEWRTGKRGYLE